MNANCKPIVLRTGPLTPERIATIGVMLIAALLYLPALGGGLVWDDHYMLDGQAIGGGHSFLRCFTQPFFENYYRPLVSASFFIERKLFHSTPLYFHQTNVLLHVAATGLLMAALW